MIRKDYILRMIEELAQRLGRIRRKMDEAEFPEAGVELDEAFQTMVGTGADAVGRLSETELLARLTLDGPTQMVKEKTLMLIALLQQAGELRVAEGREEAGEACWLKALNLLLTVERQDFDLEMPEFVPKIDLLRDELREAVLPLETLAALWRHHERTGEYARAEDALSDLLAAQPDNAELRSEAKLFYERLLRQSDYALEEGNLPRAEAEAGLAGLAK
jgi:hypothetical protein